MSAAYYIVLNKDQPGFDVFVNGKYVGSNADRINQISKNLSLKPLDEYVSQDLSEFGDESEDIENEEIKWFEPSEGIGWAKRLSEFIKKDKKSVTNVDGVISDLNEYIAIFEMTESIGAKWHFELDF
ncbi:MAG: hypothetical protein JW795_04925 [Chitinivibrionales bacterium]|nr:hypothetical protein [Chitinivibrionales bacterium]